jgi:hypothetical protein
MRHGHRPHRDTPPTPSCTRSGTHSGSQGEIPNIACSDSRAIIQLPSNSGSEIPRLLIAWAGPRQDPSIYWTARNFPLTGGIDSTDWESQRTIANAKSSESPTFATLDGKLYMAWKGPFDDHRLYWPPFDETGQVPGPETTLIPGRGSEHAPNIIGLNGRLHMFWKGIPNDPHVYHASIAPGTHDTKWTDQEQVLFYDNDASGSVSRQIGATGPMASRPVAATAGRAMYLDIRPVWRATQGVQTPVSATEPTSSHVQR